MDEARHYGSVCKLRDVDNAQRDYFDASNRVAEVGAASFGRVSLKCSIAFMRLSLSAVVLELILKIR